MPLRTGGTGGGGGISIWMNSRTSDPFVLLMHIIDIRVSRSSSL